ncbi:hypothetical protein CISIN_1g035222mg [Citrus sinensis]|uniref:Uncharacterized protein n=1 Tax=Citrus sinensis TaxID=2711 RepID=A0A067DMV8_CITSI|nr:hypothetical protein CISIN_1g035222mg [Citrus sinensis]
MCHYWIIQCKLNIVAATTYFANNSSFHTLTVNLFVAATTCSTSISVSHTSQRICLGRSFIAFLIQSNTVL